MEIEQMVEGQVCQTCGAPAETTVTVREGPDRKVVDQYHLCARCDDRETKE